MTNETCENCRHWDSSYVSADPDRGRCNGIGAVVWRYYADLWPENQGGEYMTTWAGFGCKLFKGKKEQRPFFPRRLSGGNWAVVARSSALSNDTDATVGFWDTEGMARNTCAWLNDRWARRNDDD